MLIKRFSVSRSESFFFNSANDSEFHLQNKYNISKKKQKGRRQQLETWRQSNIEERKKKHKPKTAENILYCDY